MQMSLKTFNLSLKLASDNHNDSCLVHRYSINFCHSSQAILICTHPFTFMPNGIKKPCRETEVQITNRNIYMRVKKSSVNNNWKCKSGNVIQMWHTTHVVPLDSLLPLCVKQMKPSLCCGQAKKNMHTMQVEELNNFSLNVILTTLVARPFLKVVKQLFSNFFRRPMHLCTSLFSNDKHASHYFHTNLLVS